MGREGLSLLAPADGGTRFSPRCVQGYCGKTVGSLSVLVERDASLLLQVVAVSHLFGLGQGRVCIVPKSKTNDVDLLAYWCLNERPFEPTWDTRFFFEGREH